jgi:FkbM family methyltransferase
MTQPWQGRAAFVPGCALLRHLCNLTTGENMNLFPNADALDVFRQDIDKIRAAMQEGANHLLHIHNLQHAIIQEIVNTNLYRSYESLGKAKVLEFEYDGASVKLFLPTGPIDLIQRDILWKRNFFHPESLEMIRALMPMSGERILDIGAYIGNHTVFFAKICGAAEVESFEPVRSSFRALERNAQINNVNAKLHNFGLGAVAGEARVNLVETNAGGSALQHFVGGGVKVAPLDSLDLAPFRAMKIDVEGMAVEVLLGARRSIETNWPSIVVEAFPHEFEAVNDLLISMSYRKIGQVSDDHVYVVA